MTYAAFQTIQETDRIFVTEIIILKVQAMLSVTDNNIDEIKTYINDTLQCIEGSKYIADSIEYINSCAFETLQSNDSLSSVNQLKSLESVLSRAIETKCYADGWNVIASFGSETV